MTTARDIINASMRKIHVLGDGQTLSNDQAQDALQTLNALLSSWSVEGGNVYTETVETFPLSSSVTHTIGSGGDFNTTRPFNIVAAYVSIGSTDYSIEQWDQTQYSKISYKDITGVPDIFYYDNNSPLGTIYLYPSPSGVDSITLHSYKPITEFTSLTDDITLPPSMERALVFNLAIDIAPEYEREPSMAVVKIAEDSKRNLLAYNSRNENHHASSDNALIAHTKYNIYRGY